MVLFAEISRGFLYRYMTALPMPLILSNSVLSGGNYKGQIIRHNSVGTDHTSQQCGDRSYVTTVWGQIIRHNSVGTDHTSQQCGDRSYVTTVWGQIIRHNSVGTDHKSEGTHCLMLKRNRTRVTLEGIDHVLQEGTDHIQQVRWDR